MVEPIVLRSVGCEPEEVTGFAYALGIERFVVHFTINCVVWLARSGDCRPLVAALFEAGG